MTDQIPTASAAPAAPAPKVSFVSLGCPKALVDSERIVTQLRAEGYQLTKSHAGADVVVVNTCGFLDSAKAESLAAIGDAMAANRVTHTIDPWSPASANRNIAFNGEKTQTAHQALNAQVRSTQRYVKTVELISCVLTLSVGMLGYLIVLTLVDHWIVDLGIVGRTLALLALLAGCGWFVAKNLLPLIWHPINPVYAAREIELACPSLKNRLINLLLLRAEPRNTPAAVFQTLEQQVERNLATVAIDSVVDRTRVIRLAWVLTAIVVFIGGYKIGRAHV